jgi:phosphonate degradation associated HDIG domain protein
MEDGVNPMEMLFELLRREGKAHYGDSAVTQFEHALQCAALAEQDRASPALITAALFHDIGHLINPGDRAAALRSRDGEHEITGAEHLAQWFGDDVILPVRLHVPAKRYLAAVDPAYAATLSPRSTFSLEWRGGPFSPEQVRRFAAAAGAGDAIRLRRWDEGAKRQGAPIRELEDFQPYVAASLIIEAMGDLSRALLRRDPQRSNGDKRPRN